MILGVNIAYHDISVALVNGDLSAIEEERINGIKHGMVAFIKGTAQFPVEGIYESLRIKKHTINDVTHLAIAFNPWLQISGDVARGIRHFITLRRARILTNTELAISIWRTPVSLKRLRYFKPNFNNIFDNRTGNKFITHFVEHHLAHAGGSFLVSPFAESAILSIDGIGENCCTLLGFGRQNDIKKIKEINYPHSLGFFYEEITKFLGFQRNNDEYKVMGLAAYGKPKYINELKRLVDIREDGDYKVHIDFMRSGYLPARELSDVLGAPRMFKGELTERHADIAASAQSIIEEVILGLARWLYKKTGSKNLCMAGGVALNCVMNERIREDGPFESIFIQPAASDAGTALGAALWVKHCILKEPREYVMETSYLGPEYCDTDIQAKLEERKISFCKPKDIATEVAKLIAAGQIVGWFQGKMEWGPRALGNRSILADPRDASMKARLNAVKGREDFRPFAPSILEEYAGDYLECGDPSPFMMFARKVKPELRSKIPAVVHVDGTSRVQTVSEEQNPKFYRLIKAFYQLTGIPMVLNTSFNTRAKPIVCTVDQALECFVNSGLDMVALGPFLIGKQCF